MTKRNVKIANSSNFDRIFAIIGILIPFIQFLKVEIEKRDVRNKLQDSLDKPIKNLEKSTNDLLHAYQLILGSTIFYRVIEPMDSDKESDAVMENFREKYHKVLVDIRQLIKHLDLYDSELTFISNNENRFALKHIKQAFIEKNPNFEYILEDPKCQKLIQKMFTKEKTYNEKLSRAIKKTNKELNIKLTYVETLRKLFLSKSFQKELKEFVDKLGKKIVVISRK